MKTRKRILPDWIVKKIEFEHENESVNSAVVGITALYIVGVIGLLFSKPFGGENLWMEIGIAICVLAVIVAAIMIFIAQVALLERTRIKAMEAYKRALAKEEKAKQEEKKAKTEEEKAKAVEKEAEAQKEQAMWAETLETLHVKLKEAA
ncbi:hypothetical protein IKN40_03035 [bacterium]|nr:hypothetical protein [bacterium]